MHSWMVWSCWELISPPQKMCATTRVSRRWAARSLEVSEECPSPDCEGMEHRSSGMHHFKLIWFWSCVFFSGWEILALFSTISFLMNICIYVMVFPGSILQPLMLYLFTASSFCLGMFIHSPYKLLLSGCSFLETNLQAKQWFFIMFYWVHVLLQ